MNWLFKSFESSPLKIIPRIVRPKVAAITLNTIKRIDRLKANKILKEELRIRNTILKTKISKNRSNMIRFPPE